MKNVIVFALSGARYAVELRWVREVTALGHVTPVPGAPDEVSGVVNFRGAIVPLLGVGGDESPRKARPGDTAVLLEVEGALVAVRIDIVHSVCTLQDREDGPGLVDPQSDETIPLLEPPVMIREATAATQAVAKEAR